MELAAFWNTIHEMCLHHDTMAVAKLFMEISAVEWMSATVESAVPSRRSD